MKRIHLSLVALIATSSLYAAQPTNAELLKRIEQLEAEKSGKQIVPVAQITEDSEYGKLKISGDYRFSVDNLDYDMADGSNQSNDGLLTNRLWLNFSYKPNRHIDFNTKLAFNKVFGQPMTQAAFDGFDWLSSTTNTDDEFRVKNAYINYRDDTLLGTNIPWNFGVGRRSTSYNKLLSLRDDMAPNSPLGHIVSAEFDGGHLGFDFSKVTGVSGMSLKLAAGRGASYIMPTISYAPDADIGENINMFAFNFVPYSDEALHTELQAMYVTNLIDLQDMNDPSKGFNDVGDMYLSAFMVSYKAAALNNTLFFASVGLSQTKPNEGQGMLGSTDDETGLSYWVGAQWDCLLTDNAKVGIEYNHGDQYWRSFTYAEDTVAGSKMAVRGDAYEFYFTKEITKGLSFQARYTYMNYDYTGSNGFFGNTTGNSMKISDIKKAAAGWNGMTPAQQQGFQQQNPQMAGQMEMASNMSSQVVESAQDIRFYLRYKF